MIDEVEQKLQVCHTKGLDTVEEPEIGQGDSQKTPPAKKKSFISRHQHLASAASDNGSATPKPCRTACQHPNTYWRVRKKKPRIVFSSDEPVRKSFQQGR